MRKRVIGVMGGANVSDDVLATARRLGSLIAERGWILLNGGRNAGVMAASARGAKEAGGTVVGVLPGGDADGACDHVDIAIVTGLGDARNVVNVLSSDVVIACHGGAGTLSEIALALKNDKPVVLLGFGACEALAPYLSTGMLLKADSASAAVECAAALLSE